MKSARRENLYTVSAEERRETLMVDDCGLWNQLWPTLTDAIDGQTAQQYIFVDTFVKR